MNIFLTLKLDATDEDTNLDFYVDSKKSFNLDPDTLSLEDKEWLSNTVAKAKEKLTDKLFKKFNKECVCM